MTGGEELDGDSESGVWEGGEGDSAGGGRHAQERPGKVAAGVGSGQGVVKRDADAGVGCRACAGAWSDPGAPDWPGSQVCEIKESGAAGALGLINQVSV